MIGQFCRSQGLPFIHKSRYSVSPSGHMQGVFFAAAMGCSIARECKAVRWPLGDTPEAPLHTGYTCVAELTNGITESPLSALRALI